MNPRYKPEGFRADPETLEEAARKQEKEQNESAKEN
jgi:hypothetical protein